MRIQRKLLIGFLTIASIGSGMLAYNNQITSSLETNVEYSKDVADADTAKEDANLSETAKNTQDILLSPDQTNENQTSEGETPKLAPPDANVADPSETASRDKASSEKSPAISAPQKNTPANTIPEETQSTEDTHITNNSPVDTQAENNSVDTLYGEIITYEELEKYLTSKNEIEENNPSAPNATPPGSTTPESSPSLNSDYANQVLSILNQEGANAGLPALTMNQGAANAAAVRAKEIVSSFSHTRPSGQSPFTALGEAGVSYRFAGENIAYGQKTPTEVMNGWMNSSGHRANILSSNFTQVGIACYDAPNSQNGYYWVQLFIG